MRLFKMVIPRILAPLAVVVLIAAACSSDSDETTPPVESTAAATAQPTESSEGPAPEGPAPEPTEAPAPEPTEASVGLSTGQQELADAVFTALVEDDERPAAMTEDQLRCLADDLAGVFPEERLGELGLNGESVAAVYASRGVFALEDEFGISDGEVSEVVDVALGCVDWRAFMAEVIAAEGATPEQASCFAEELSDEGLQAVVRSALIAESDVDYGLGESEMMAVVQTCVDVRETLYETFLQEGLSEESARCVADGLSDEVVDMMLGGLEPEDDEEALEMIGELLALQNRCLTPEEIETMGGFGG